MGQTVLVDHVIDDGERLVRQLRSDGVNVEAAFWLKSNDEESWYFYVASKLVDDAGIAAAYRKIHQSMNKLTDLRIDSFDVKAISTQHPMAVAAVDVQKRHPAPLATWYRGARLGDTAIDSAYLYPVSSAVP